MADYKLSYTGDQINAAIGRSLAGAAQNLLDNSDFTAPVNQRNKTTYSEATQYTIDRWKTSNNNTSVTVTDEGIKLTNTVEGSAGNLQQTLRNPEKLLGRTFTLAACLADGTIVVASSTLPTSFQDTIKQYATLLINGLSVGAIQISNNSVWVRIWSNASETTRTFRWVALYEGAYTANTLPPYVPKGYVTELAECRRYAVALSGDLVPSTGNTANLMFFLIPYPCTLDISESAPSVNGTLTVKNSSAVAQSGFTFAVSVTASGIFVQATKTAHGLTGGYLYASAGTMITKDL